MNRKDALSLVKSRISNTNLYKHILAVEAVMRSLAKELNHDQDKWGLVGLLHDLDYEETKNAPEKHTLITAEILQTKGIAKEIIDAVKAHAYGFGVAGIQPPGSAMEHAIYCADPVTGFLVACALIHPEKKLAPIDVEFVRNRMKEKRFAAGANRDAMQTCSNLNITLDKFLQISLDAMKSISADLGL
jgi:putative nucleotidyltransferase with HDIG domain